MPNEHFAPSLRLKVPCLLEFRPSGQGSSITVRKTIRCCVDCHNAFKASSRAWLGFGAFTQSALALLTAVFRFGVLGHQLCGCCCGYDGQDIWSGSLTRSVFPSEIVEASMPCYKTDVALTNQRSTSNPSVGSNFESTLWGPSGMFETVREEVALQACGRTLRILDQAEWPGVWTV